MEYGLPINKLGLSSAVGPAPRPAISEVRSIFCIAHDRMMILITQDPNPYLEG